MVKGVIMNWYIYSIKKYAVFSGRSSRNEYWYFVLFNFLIRIILYLLNLLPTVGKIFGIISIIYSIGIFIPTLAVTVRRLHDNNRSGFNIFLIFVPFVGIIILLVYLIQNGTSEENQYGYEQKTNNVLTKEIKINKKIFVPILVIFVVILITLFFYFGFRNISGKEIFGIFNLSNKNYYLNIVSEKSITQFSFKKYEEINGIKYIYILKSGKYKLKNARTVFQCERNNNIDIYKKLKNIFNEMTIVDENDNIIWNINDDNVEGITKNEGFFQTVFWNLLFE
jgi:uncharacterized membrane protein YhaH (DUF805 family)